MTPETITIEAKTCVRRIGCQWARWIGRDDLAQEAAISLWQSRDEPMPWKWKCQRAKRAAQQARRRLVGANGDARERMSRSVLSLDRADLHTLTGREDAGLAEVERRMDWEVALGLIQATPEPARSILLARAEGVTLREIAQDMGMPEPTATSLARRAIERMRAALRREGRTAR